MITTLARLVGKPVRSIVRRSRALALLEARIIAEDAQMAPLFIIGTPRSGSTLLYQLVAYYFSCSYFTNIVSVFPNAPALITRLSWRGQRYDDSSFASSYGLSAGLYAPSEAGAVFHRWLGDVAEVSDAAMRGTVAVIANTMGGPFIWKNLNVTFVMSDVMRVFPNAMFVHISRDVAAVCQSILMGLKNRQVGNVSQVMSPRQQGNIEAVVEGVRRVEREVDVVCKRTGVAPYRIDYADLCADHASSLTGLQEFCESYGNVLVLGHSAHDE